MKDTSEKLSGIYKRRFSSEELAVKNRLWRILIDYVMQKFIRDGDSVLDIGGGECLFINNVRCGKKYVVDLNPDTERYANDDVTVIQERADRIPSIPDESIDVVFVSNFFEHMKDKDELERVISEIRRVLVDRGLLLVIQPNIRYAYKEYWDFFDHYVPISDKSLTELLRLYDFEIKLCHPRFLPYSTKSRLSGFTGLLKIYLRVPLLRHVVGKQLFLVAQKPGEEHGQSR
jgi:SAM-dependent methyltransferase